jgi:DTW domain-containing protein YfiP
MSSIARAERRLRPHRAVCYECWKPRVACICGLIERVANRTGVLILQHPRERRHPIGTVRIARLGLTRLRIEPCVQWGDTTNIRARLPAGAALLYPAAGAADLAKLSAAERPSHLILIDATWFQAKKIYDGHHWLRALPHVRLSPSAPSRYQGVRREPRPHCLATLEAIVAALRILEPQTPGLDRLLVAFDAMVERQASFTPAMPGASAAPASAYA